MKAGDRLYEFTAKDGERTHLSGIFEIVSTDNYTTILHGVDGQNNGETRMCTTSQIGPVLLAILADGRFTLRAYLDVNDWDVADRKFHERLTAELNKHIKRAEMWKKLVRDWEQCSKTISLAQALCDQGITSGFAEARRLIHGGAITVNGVLAESWNMPVKQDDVITCGKHKTISIGPRPGSMR